jgi:hypothetical protein
MSKDVQFFRAPLGDATRPAKAKHFVRSVAQERMAEGDKY